MKNSNCSQLAEDEPEKDNEKEETEIEEKRGEQCLRNQGSKDDEDGVTCHGDEDEDCKVPI